MKDDSLFAESDVNAGALTLDLKDETLAEIEEEEDDSFNDEADQQFKIFTENTEADSNFIQNDIQDDELDG